MKKILILVILFSTVTFAQQLESKKIFSIDVSVGDFSKDGDYLSNQILYAPYTKGEFSGITKGQVLPVGGDFGTFYVKDNVMFMELDIDLIMLTEDGEKIHCKASGMCQWVASTFKSISSSVSWRFFTSSEKYKYLNEEVGVGFVTNSSPESGYAFHHDIYLVSQN